MKNNKIKYSPPNVKREKKEWKGESGGGREDALWKHVCHTDVQKTVPFFWGGCLFSAKPSVYRGSQARDQIRATAAILHHSHSNMGPKLCPQLVPQLTATLGP